MLANVVENLLDAALRKDERQMIPVVLQTCLTNVFGKNGLKTQSASKIVVIK